MNICKYLCNDIPQYEYLHHVHSLTPPPKYILEQGWFFSLMPRPQDPKTQYFFSALASFGCLTQGCSEGRILSTPGVFRPPRLRGFLDMRREKSDCCSCENPKITPGQYLYKLGILITLKVDTWLWPACFITHLSEAEQLSRKMSLDPITLIKISGHRITETSTSLTHKCGEAWHKRSFNTSLKVEQGAKGSGAKRCERICGFRLLCKVCVLSARTRTRDSILQSMAICMAANSANLSPTLPNHTIGSFFFSRSSQRQPKMLKVHYFKNTVTNELWSK